MRSRVSDLMTCLKMRKQKNRHDDEVDKEPVVNLLLEKNASKESNLVTKNSPCRLTMLELRCLKRKVMVEFWKKYC